MNDYYEDQARGHYLDAVAQLRRMDRDDLILIIERLALPLVGGSHQFAARRKALLLALAMYQQPDAPFPPLGTPLDPDADLPAPDP